MEIVRQGSKFDDYAGSPGWRATGDVRFAYDAASVIFPAVAGERYLDETPGYCLLATGNAQYVLSGNDAAFMPGPNGLGQTSEMCRKLSFRPAVKSIQVRVAFFSQEFPQYVGSKFNDSFFIKFDESIDMIASGNLNDLAGANSADAAVVAAVSACKDLATTPDATGTCGDWVHTSQLTNGDLWNINSSEQGPKQADKYCGGAAGTAATTV